MRGLLLLFIVICGIGIGWNYMTKPTRVALKKWLSNNLWVVILAFCMVGVAIFVSINTTVRFL